MWEVIEKIAIILNLAALFLGFFLGISSFDAIGFLKRKIGRRVLSQKIDVVYPDVSELKIANLKHLSYFVAEFMRIELNPYGYGRVTFILHTVIFLPAMLGVIASIILSVSEASPYLVSFLALSGVLWLAFWLWQYVPFASFVTPTEVLFRGEEIVIHSPWPQVNDGEGPLILPRRSVKFKSGHIPGIFGALDLLYLSVECEDGDVLLICVPRWFARISGIRNLIDTRDSLNAVRMNVDQMGSV